MIKKWILSFLFIYFLLIICIHTTSFFIKETTGNTESIALFYSSNQQDMDLRLKKATVLVNNEVIYFALGGARPYKNYYGSIENSKYLKSFGISEEHIKVDLNSYDTKGNLEALKTLNNTHKKVTLVSDHYHLARITLLNIFNPLPFEIINSPSEMPNDLSWRFVRLNYELIAWCFMILPNSLKEFLLLTFRK